MSTEAPPRPPRGDHVLIIEDSPVQAKIISKQIMLLSEFPTAVAHTMEEARDLLASRREEFFVAVVDLNLPDAPDGEAVDLVLSFDLPMVVLTATFNEDIRQNFINKKVADFFFKGSIQDMDPMVHSLERIYRNYNITVLLVDDTRFERSLMRRLLQVQNYVVLEAENGEEGVEMLDQHPEIRMIVTDYEMPRMDGLEFIKAVRQRFRKDKLAVVGVSAAGSGALSALLLKNGANDFLTKPFEVEEFYCRVNQTMDMMEAIQELQTCMEQLG